MEGLTVGGVQLTLLPPAFSSQYALEWAALAGGVILLLLLLWRCYAAVRALWEPATPASAPLRNVVFPYGVSEDVGLRPYMEDRHAVAGDVAGNPHLSLYAVFDGHGGARAADFCSRNVALLLSRALMGGEEGGEEGGAAGEAPADPPTALGATFAQLDKWWLSLAAAHSPPMDDGTTAVAALVVADPALQAGKAARATSPPGEGEGGSPRRPVHVYVANAGDSRAVVVKRSGRVQPLTEDHKPNRPDEMARIRAAGGTVQFYGVWRVQGVLAVSRAIGDRQLKPFIVSSPEVTRYSVTGHDQYLVLATDGLWDVLSNAEVASVLSCLPAGSTTAAAQLLVKEALTRGSSDNITALVVDLSAQQYPAEGAGGGGEGWAPPAADAAGSDGVRQRLRASGAAGGDQSQDCPQDAAEGGAQAAARSPAVGGDAEGGPAPAAAAGGARVRSWARRTGGAGGAGGLRGAAALGKLASRGKGPAAPTAQVAGEGDGEDGLRALKAADAGVSKVE